MATAIWEVVGQIECGRVVGTARLLEQRVYPSDLMPDAGLPYQVWARKCQHGLQCQAAGYPCRWSGLNPCYDPFHVRTAD
jgi:hypothetical protein